MALLLLSRAQHAANLRPEGREFGGPLGEHLPSSWLKLPRPPQHIRWLESRAGVSGQRLADGALDHTALRLAQHARRGDAPRARNPGHRLARLAEITQLV